MHEHYTTATVNSWVEEDTMRNGNGLPHGEVEKFMRLVKDAKQKLYPSCEKFFKLSFIVKLLHLKILNHWSNKSFTMLLELLKEALPNGERLPNHTMKLKR